MVRSKASSSNSKFVHIASFALLGLLAACGEQGSSQAPSASPKASTVQANTAKPCTYAAGHPAEGDAELFRASAEGDVPRVKRAIEAGGKVAAADSLHRTPLFAAAFCNRPEVEELLIEKGSPVDAKDFLGMSPLHAAVLVGGVEAAKTLLAKGANINSRNTAGTTPLHLAAATHQLAMVDTLIERGAEVQPHDLDAIDPASLLGKNEHPITAATIKKLQEAQKHPIPN